MWKREREGRSEVPRWAEGVRHAYADLYTQFEKSEEDLKSDGRINKDYKKLLRGRIDSLLEEVVSIDTVPSFIQQELARKASLWHGYNDTRAYLTRIQPYFDEANAAVLERVTRDIVQIEVERKSSFAAAQKEHALHVTGGIINLKHEMDYVVSVTWRPLPQVIPGGRVYDRDETRMIALLTQQEQIVSVPEVQGRFKKRYIWDEAEEAQPQDVLNWGRRIGNNLLEPLKPTVRNMIQWSVLYSQG